ncbi:hypothetical protein RMATCC62417_17271 [Rhizopus microsporus]|nr:hypothetical protein RMATCC62417_17271 [Rhizopus microsporus]
MYLEKTERGGRMSIKKDTCIRFNGYKKENIFLCSLFFLYIYIYSYFMSSYLHHINSTHTLSSPIVDGQVDHVVFVIHGIGRQTEKFGFFQKHLQSLFDTTNEAVEMNRPGTRVNIQYIPIEWHKHIHEETDAIMDQVTPRSITGLRMINNDYLADAFFYLSNDRGQSIINHVTQTFNTSYHDFMNANPGFSGKIAASSP